MEAWLGLIGALLGGALALAGGQWREDRAEKGAARAVARALFWELDGNRQLAYSAMENPGSVPGLSRTAFDAGFLQLARLVPRSEPLLLSGVVDAYRDAAVLAATVTYAAEAIRERSYALTETCLIAMRELAAWIRRFRSRSVQEKRTPQWPGRLDGGSSPLTARRLGGQAPARG